MKLIQMEKKSKEGNPWKTLSRKEIYQNPWIQVEEHQVITPSGTNGIYGQVHMKNLAIGIIPVDDQNHTWLVGQFRYTLNQYSWEIPMGGGPIGINPIESAQRELKEETGLSAQHWEELIRIHTSNSVTDELGIAYLATGLQQGKAEWDETEQLQIKRLPLSEVLQMILSGEITDSLTVAAILKLRIDKPGLFE